LTYVDFPKSWLRQNLFAFRRFEVEAAAAAAAGGGELDGLGDQRR